MTAPAEQQAPAPPMPAPRRWKMWILTVCAIYPVITTLGYIVEAIAVGLPVWAHFLILAPIAVALLVFWIMPMLTKRFFPWLTR